MFKLRLSPAKRAIHIKKHEFSRSKYSIRLRKHWSIAYVTWRFGHVKIDNLHISIRWFAARWERVKKCSSVSNFGFFGIVQTDEFLMSSRQKLPWDSNQHNYLAISIQGVSLFVLAEKKPISTQLTVHIDAQIYNWIHVFQARPIQREVSIAVALTKRRHFVLVRMKVQLV